MGIVLAVENEIWVRIRGKLAECVGVVNHESKIRHVPAMRLDTRRRSLGILDCLDGSLLLATHLQWH